MGHGGTGGLAREEQWRGRKRRWRWVEEWSGWNRKGRGKRRSGGGGGGEVEVKGTWSGDVGMWNSSPEKWT